MPIVCRARQGARTPYSHYYIPVKLNDNSTYGFGWVMEPLNGHKTVVHSGRSKGFSTFGSRFVDDKFTVS